MAVENKKEKTKKVNKKVVEAVEVNTKKLLELLGLEVNVEVSEDKDNDAIFIDIQSEKEAGLLIGNRGKTLNAIQLILSMICNKQLGDWKRILVNVADWREKETERIESLANQAADRAVTTQKAQTLYNLTASQRRIVHMTLANKKDVKTESEGEGKERFLVVYPK